MNWQESRIKFLELKVKEKEKLELELESVKEVGNFVSFQFLYFTL